MVSVAFAKKGSLPPKEEAHWRVLSVVGFAVVHEAFIRMEPYRNLFQRIFSERVLSVGKPPKTVLMEGFALAATQIG